MKRIGISLAIIAAIAIGPVAITSAGASAFGTDAPPAGAIIVDNHAQPDLTQDPACDISTFGLTDYNNIQDAVTYDEGLASPHPIYVCAGTYSGSVIIDSPNIVLDGAQWGTDGYTQFGSSQPETLLEGTGGLPAIWYINTSVTPFIGDQANGFDIVGGAGIGIYAVNAGSDFTFEDNIIDASNGGIVMNTDGVSSPDSTQIQGNYFDQETPFTPPAGGFTGTAIDFFLGTANKVSIQGNWFEGLSGSNGDIDTKGTGACTGVANDPKSSDQLLISGNTYDQNIPLVTSYGNSFVNLVCTSGAEVNYNYITVEDSVNTNAVSPIYLGGGDLDNPLIYGNQEYGDFGGVTYASGIEFTSMSFSGDDPTIEQNLIEGFGEGIWGYGGNNANSAPSDFTIDEGNQISDGLVGIDIFPILGSPTGGTITGNYLSANVTADCVDGTSGTGTAGTANTWTVNAAASPTPSYPAGLCDTNIVTPGPNPATAYVGGTGFTPYASATSGDTTTTSDPTDLPNVPITVSLDSSSTGCYLSAGVIGYNGSGTCVIDFTDPGYNQYGEATAQQSFPVGSGVGGSSGSGAAPASSTSVTLTFNSEGGSSEPSQTVTSGTSVTLPTPTLTGDTFLGWFTSATGGTLVTSPYVVTASTTLYAQWEANASTPAAAAFRYAFTIHTFVFGSSALTAQIKDQINHLVVLFNAHDVVHINLRGNATLPNNSYNQALARARAAAVEAYMRSVGIHASITTTATVSGATYNFAYLVVYVTTP